jgi:photosystem II stability/assembly factor-like uncharacterized protein
VKKFALFSGPPTHSSALINELFAAHAALFLVLGLGFPMKVRRLLLPLLLVIVTVGLQLTGHAQPPTPSSTSQLFNALPARAIGPTTMGGRIIDVAVVESDPATMYVAAATGGVWKTTDNGLSWRPIFDQAGTLCIGDVAVAPSNPDIVWVGTGEANILRSVSIGDGVYKSTDGGKTWKHVGLKETRHVGRMLIHPKNPDIVYVAALGHAWGPNEERGVFKTTDGGKSWDKVLYLNENTGIIDLAMDPSEPDLLYASAYHFRRDAMSGSEPRIQWGPGSGLYRSEDGGKSWSQMKEGLPERPMGRCGLDVYRKDPNIVYATVQTDQTGSKGKKDDVPGAGGIYRSEDKGKTWKRMTSWMPPLTFHFYFGQIRVDPNDDQRLYVAGINMHVSTDGGKSFSNVGGGFHADQHALWINPKNSDHLVLGNDGGLYFSKDRAKTWQPIRGMPLGQYYALGVDMRQPYWIYGGTQDNGSWGGPSATYHAGIGDTDWRSVAGGDGFYCQVDPTDPDTVYCEAQYGVLQRVNLKAGGKGGRASIKPKAAKGEEPYRFNWNSPILISPHAPKTIYFGGNFLFRSKNRGDTWETISPDLSRGGKPQDTGHTITTIAESPFQAGLLWAGTDDGRVHVSKNGGKDWTEVTGKIPNLERNGGWITRVECSYHAEGTAYVSVDRHRNDDLAPYLYKTTDYGATWQAVAGDLPKEGNIHVVRESSKNENLLFVGTEFGVWGTLDGGKHWHHLKDGLPPAVLVHDLVIHPRERELVVGTHGRSLYIIDIAPLEEMTAKALAADAHLCAVRPAVAFQVKMDTKTTTYLGTNPPYGARVSYHLKEASKEPVTVFVLAKDGKTLATLPGKQKAGLHQVVWNLREGDTLAAPGEYVVRLQVGDRSWTTTVRVEAEEMVSRRLRSA